MRISPLSPPCRMVTFVPSASASLSCSAFVSASTGAAPFRGRARLAGILAQAFDVPDRQALGDDAVGERVRLGDGEQGARVPGGNLSAREQAARVLGQVGQAKRVRDMAPAFADDAGDVAVRIPIIGAELGVARGLFERVQIRPLHVFNDGDLKRFAVAGFDDNDRNLVQASPLGGPPAALAGDDFIRIRDAGDGANDHRLDDPALLDRGGQFFELRVVESLSRIAGIGAQELDRRLARAARGFGVLGVRPAQQGRQSSAQAWAIFDAGCVFGHGPFLRVLST